MIEVQERPRLVLEHQPEANHYDTLERDRMAAEQSTQTSPEEWRPVPGFEGKYEVSDHGRVKSLDRLYTDSLGRTYARRGRMLALRSEKKTGYKVCDLTVGSGHKTSRVHRLVLAAFVGPCPDGMLACHNNGDPSDNRLANLRWDTQSENMYDKRKHGTDHEVNKRECPRGHPLTMPNLCRYPWEKDGHRECLACARASHYISQVKRRSGVDLGDSLDQLADSYFDQIAEQSERTVS